jgi:hypothetical protein
MKSPKQLLQAAQERAARLVPGLLSPLATAAPPSPEEGIVLGRDTAGAPFTIAARHLSTHADIVGGIGGGKSTLLRGAAQQILDAAIRKNFALILIDPHGNHPDAPHRAMVRHVVETGLCTRKRIYVIDANSAWCTGLNLFGGRAVPSVKADNIREAFERMQGDENLLSKPSLRRIMQGVLAALAELNLTLAEADLLLDRIDPHGMREWALSQIQDRYAKKALLRLQYLATDPRLAKEYEVDTIGSENRLSVLLASPAMRAIVGTPMLDLGSVLDEGGVLLVNAAGHDAASETAGDLLGKLVMRAILFAAKRRRTNSPVLVIADECARYVSQDWERALAELRKYNVGLWSTHQTFAMLGQPGDSVRDAIEKIPATRIVFRLTSMQEATVLAPELMRLNLEMPVDLLTAPTVVDYEVRRSRSATLGTSATESHTAGTTRTTGAGTVHSTGHTAGESQTASVSEERTLSRGTGRTRGASRGESTATGITRSHQESETRSATTGTTHTTGRSTMHGGARTEQSSSSRSTSRQTGGGTNQQRSSARGDTFNESFDIDPNSWPGGQAAYDQAAMLGGALGRHVGAGSSTSDSETSGKSTTWVEGESTAQSESTAASETWADTVSESDAVSEQQGRSHGTADGVAYSETRGTSQAESEEHSESITRGTSLGRATGRGSHTDRTRSVARSREASLGKTTSASMGRGRSASTGWSEVLAPVMEKRPHAIHSLQNVTHMAAEKLCTLPTGVAVVRTLKNGKVEGAIVKVPERPSPPVTDEQYAADLAIIAEHSTAIPMAEAMREIDRREERLLKQAADYKALTARPVEPESYRVAAPQAAAPEEPTSFRVRSPKPRKPKR